MMRLTAEWRKNNPPPPKQVPKTTPVASSRNSNVKGSHKLRTSEKERHQPQNLTVRVAESQIFRRIPWKMYFRWPEDGITEKGGSQIKISDIISDIFYYIPELYEDINDVKTQVSDKNSSICNNLKVYN
ncbi:hypothetical protein O181_097870 [Austropuccinia psidii MF-1]|uniref:Uncharacterized protein n=1 Tax=Austropuccinia psidii MF-1 TaxID=1389203 RepID=A0A9Q3PEC8_9BASI|nr:hypothetical protein [Austropuccinia psidii MF-1]